MGVSSGLRSADHGRRGIAKRLPSGSRSRCRTVSMHTTAATRMFPTTAATAGIGRMCRLRTPSPTDEPCCTLRAQARRPRSMSGRSSPENTPVATTSSSSISPTSYRSHRRQQHRRQKPQHQRRRIKRKGRKASQSRCSATTRAIWTGCPQTSATSASTAACTGT